jgi:hypothetical protein
MTYLIRAAFIALSLATIIPVASAATVNDTSVSDASVKDAPATIRTPATIQQDWANG